MVDLVYAILILVFGLFFLVTPYEKIQEKFPKVKSPKLIKIVGGICVVCAVLMLLLSFL